MRKTHISGPWKAVEIGQGGPADNPMPVLEIRSADDRAVIAEYVDPWNAPILAAAPDLLDAAQCAVHVLFLLEREVEALGFRAGNVREKLSAAIRKAGADDGRWNERLAEARSDLADAIAEREQLE